MGARAAAETIRRLDIAGSIGIDLPSANDKGARQAAAAARSLKGRARASLIVLASRLLPLPWALRVAQGSIRLNEM